MPTIAVDKEDLFNSLGRYYSTQEFDELCFDFGIELDEDTSLEDLPAGERPQLKIEVPANRYDLLCYEGIARALNIFLGRGKIPNYTLLPTSKPEQIIVKPETSQIRQFISGAILRNIKFDERRYESFIALQDKLHSNICRNRTLVSVGTHDLDTIKGPFTYEALKPQDIVFTPLNQVKAMNGVELMEFYKNDKHLGRFLEIIRDSPVYPVVLDADRRVCSLPPIINSDLSKITLDTKNVLIEVTATDKTKMEIVTNQIVAMFSEYCADPFTVEPIDIISPHNHQSRFAPQIEPRHMTASAKYINSVCGFEPQSREKLASLLYRMGLNAHPSKSNNDVLELDIPCTRSDILHACDVVEDAAIGYGYNNLPKTFPDKSSTIGNALGINKVSDIVRREVAQAGWLEAMTLTLCSHDENFSFLNLKDDGSLAVKLANPKTSEYQVVRTSLLPGLLKTIRENLSHRLPMQIFETGDVVLKDEKLERKAYNSRRLGAVIAGKTSGFEIVHGLLDRVLAMLRIEFVSQPPKESKNGKKIYWIEQAQDLSTYFPGRAANIFVKLGHNAPIYKIGSFGVLHPSVMSKFEIPLAASSLEIDLEVFL